MSANLKQQITVRFVDVGPELATKWLTKNSINRKLRPGGVEKWMRMHQRGEWGVTHQGIAFGRSGNLLDGQHRLHAIIRLGVTVTMMVTEGLDDDAYQRIDGGMKRTPADVYGCGTGLAAVARLLAQIEDTVKGAAMTPSYLRQFIDVVAEPYNDLMDFCSNTRTIWSSAPVRTAAILKMMDGEDRDYIKLVYRSLVHLDFNTMPRIAQALYRQSQDTQRRATIGMDLFMRSTKVFTRKYQDSNRVTVHNDNTIIPWARLVIATQITNKPVNKLIVKLPKATVKKVIHHRQPKADLTYLPGLA